MNERVRNQYKGFLLRLHKKPNTKLFAVQKSVFMDTSDSHKGAHFPYTNDGHPYYTTVNAGLKKAAINKGHT